MLVLKLRRTGKRHQPFFRLVAAERRSKADGKYVEGLGWYNPRSKQYEFNKERVLYWLGQGAQKTDSVHNLLIRSGIVEGSKIPVHQKAKNPEEQSKGLENKVDENINQKEEKMEEETMQPGMESATPMPEEAAVESDSTPEETPVMPDTPVEETPTEETPAFPEVPVEETPAFPEVPVEEAPVTPETPVEEEPRF
ncbi:MAG: 30S ribosomal protein S16 [Patescibacteria group bacterium]